MVKGVKLASVDSRVSRQQKFLINGLIISMAFIFVSDFLLIFWKLMWKIAHINEVCVFNN